MPAQRTVLLLGGSGRTGRRVMAELLLRGLRVRAIVRSHAKIPAESAANPNLELVEADLLALGDADLQRLLTGCAAVISCLGHTISFKGVFGPPHDLVTQATARLCRAIAALQPTAPVKFILMSSVSVNHPRVREARRGAIERGLLWLLCAAFPPARDNQQAASFLLDEIGTGSPFLQWVVVRPDTLREGDVSAYTLHPALVDSLFAPGRSNMANVAHFMSELVANPQAWTDWQGKLPVIVNAG